MSANGKSVVVIDGANVAYEERSAGGKPKLSNLLRVRVAPFTKSFQLSLPRPPSLPRT